MEFSHFAELKINYLLKTSHWPSVPLTDPPHPEILSAKWLAATHRVVIRFEIAAYVQIQHLDKHTPKKFG